MFSRTHHVIHVILSFKKSPHFLGNLTNEILSDRKDFPTYSNFHLEKSLATKRERGWKACWTWQLKRRYFVREIDEVKETAFPSVLVFFFFMPSFRFPLSSSVKDSFLSHIFSWPKKDNPLCTSYSHVSEVDRQVNIIVIMHC